MWTISNLCQTWIGAHQLWWTEPSNSNRNTFINRFRDHQHHKQDTDLCWKVLCTYQSCCRRCRHVIIERYIYITSAIFFLLRGCLHLGTLVLRILRGFVERKSRVFILPKHFGPFRVAKAISLSCSTIFYQ